MRGFRDGDDAALDEVPQGHLRNRSAMAFGDGLERRIFEQVGIGLCYRCPRHDFRSVLFHLPFRIPLLAEDIRLQLVDSRFNLYVFGQVHEPVGVEVAYSDGAYLAGPYSLFHGPIRSVIVGEGLVYQQQVDVVGMQLAQGLFDAGCRPLFAGIANPYLGGDEEFAAGNAAFGDGGADARFVLVGLGRVDAAVARTNRIEHAPFARFGGNQIDSVPQLRHFNAVVQCHALHSVSFFIDR